MNISLWVGIVGFSVGTAAVLMGVNLILRTEEFRVEAERQLREVAREMVKAQIAADKWKALAIEMGYEECISQPTAGQSSTPSYARGRIGED